MQSKKIIKSKDYERYVFPLTGGIWRKKQCRKFVFSELEKRHPCFSDDFFFDYKFCFGIKKILVDSVVIEKRTLEEYKNKKMKVFALEGLKHRKVRVGKNYMGFYLALFFFFIIFCVFFSSIGKKASPVEQVNASEIIEEVEVIEEKDFFLMNILETVKKGNGEINSLQWKYDGFWENLSMKISGMLPDEIMIFGTEYQISPVTYNKGKPEFSISIGEKKRFEAAEGQIEWNKIRQLLMDQKVEIIEENVDLRKVVFWIEKDLSLMEQVDLLLEEMGAVVGEAVFTVNKTKGIRVELTFNHHQFQNHKIRMGIFWEYEQLFEKWKKDEPVTQVKSLEKPEKKEELIKIGQVSYPSGETVVFYKNREGKLIKKKEVQ